MEEISAKNEEECTKIETFINEGSISSYREKLRPCSSLKTTQPGDFSQSFQVSHVTIYPIIVFVHKIYPRVNGWQWG